MALGGALGLAWAPVTPRHFAWQAWHKLTPAVVSVAGVAQTHTYCRFTWQAWYRWHWVARLDWLGRPWRRATLRGRRATTWHPPSFQVAGVAQTHIHRRFAWQAWHSWHWVARLDWLGRPWRRGTLRGRRGTTWHPPSFHVAGVAQTHIHRRFAWQAWHSWHWVACLDWLGRLWRCGTLRGRRGTNSHLLSFQWQAWHKLTPTVVSRGRRGTDDTGWRAWTGLLWVAGVPQPDIHLRFTWQAWHKLTSTVVLRGRRGTHGTGWRAWTGLGARDAAALCVAGVPQPDIHLRFTWQAWHKLTSTVVLRGRRGTHGTGWRAWTGLGACDAAALCVAGVAQTHTYCRFSGRRGTNSHLLSFHVAGVAQTHIYCRFAWQAWHKLTSTVVLRGRRGTHGTGWRAWTGLGARDAAPLCVAGVPQPDIHLRFTWQAWHKLTSTVVLRGRRGTHGTGYGEHTIALIAEPGGTRRKRSNLLTNNLLTNNLPYIPTYMTYMHTYLHTYIHTFIPTYLLDLSPTPLQPLKLIIGRSWLVGLSGPLIFQYMYVSLVLLVKPAIFFSSSYIPPLRLGSDVLGRMVCRHRQPGTPPGRFIYLSVLYGKNIHISN